jgi:hypothetical protein
VMVMIVTSKQLRVSRGDGYSSLTATRICEQQCLPASLVDAAAVLGVVTFPHDVHYAVSCGRVASPSQPRK